MSRRHYRSIVCPGCSGLCDDIDVIVEDGKIASLQNICGWGSPRFFGFKKFSESPRPRIQTPMVREAEGLREADYQEALGQAVKMLKRARCVWVYGVTAVGYRAQRLALELARKVGGVFEPSESVYLSSFYEALRVRGLCGATLEEVKNNADLILFWGCNPIHTCPRHLARYSMFTRGKFTERGFQDRKVVHLDIAENEMEEVTGAFLRVDPGEDHRLMEDVITVISEKEKALTSGGSSSLAKLVDWIHVSRLGVVFAGRGLWASVNRKANMKSLFRLVETLNRSGPFVLFPYLDDFNHAGVIHLLLRETGSPEAVDFSEGGMARIGGTILDRLNQVDAVIVVGADLAWSLPREDRKRLRELPVIQIDGFETYTTHLSEVVFPSAMAGIETDEIAYRMDGIPLRLSGFMESSHPSDEAILMDLLEQM